MIKETIELLNGIEDLAVFGAKVGKDKKLSIEDIPAAIELFKESPEILKAFEGITNIDDEFKNMSVNEMKQVVDRLFSLVQKVKAELV